jgi:hypothetical protein
MNKVILKHNTNRNIHEHQPRHWWKRIQRTQRINCPYKHINRNKHEHQTQY